MKKSENSAGGGVCYQRLLITGTEFDSHPYAYTREKVIKQAEHILDHWESYQNLLESLADDASQELLARILLFRLTFDWKLNLGVASPYPHYFERDIFHLGKNEVFVDGGGFDGDTLREFLREVRQEFKGYYLFEPEEDLYKKACAVSDLPQIHCFQAGLYDKNGEIHFKMGEGNGNGTITENGVMKIRTTALDDCVDEEVSFIKLDVEGSEMKALQGAEKLIRRHRPKLAICVYHKYGDILELYEYISHLGYERFYLRAQWNNVDTEIVLYAI